MKNELKPCPYCGAEILHDSGTITNLGINGWVINHYCDPSIGELTVSISVYGKTKEEVINRWNIRNCKRNVNEL